MVAFASIACLYGNNDSPSTPNKQPPNVVDPLGILAFEAAKIVSRLISLYRSLSDPEISKLRKEILKSKGVGYLITDDQGHLLKLAYAEKMENLDKAAGAIARLGRKCPDSMLGAFDEIYVDMKSGMMDFKRFDYGSGKTKKEIRMLKKFLSMTLYLYGSMKTFPGVEVSEKKYNFPVLLKYMNFPAIDLKITPHTRKQPRHVDDNTNLWTLPFDKVLRLMSKSVCAIYSRICTVFGPYVLDLPTACVANRRQPNEQIPSEYWHLEPRSASQSPRSPRSRLVRSKSVKQFVRSNGRKMAPAIESKTNRLFLTAGLNTVGGSRLQFLYANLIMMSEESMKRKRAKDEMRDEMYRMLPGRLKGMVKVKMWKLKEETNGGKEKLKEALQNIFTWLVPMAHNTLLWQRERRVDMTSMETRTPVLLLQTLHFADKVKVEAAIAEVLGGLSLLYKQDTRRVPPPEA